MPRDPVKILVYGENLDNNFRSEIKRITCQKLLGGNGYAELTAFELWRE